MDSKKTLREHWIPLIILGFIIISSLFIRLYKLDEGLWIDEITTYTTYAKLPFLEIIGSFKSENQHPLYSILAHASFLIFGESGWALRLPAAIFGVLTIGTLYLFGQKVSNWWEALAATALMAFSYQHLWFSQNARGYTGMLFWTLLSSWYLLSAMKTPKPWKWFLFSISAAAGIYTHLTMVFVVAGQFIVYLLSSIYQRKIYREIWMGTIAGFALAFIITILLYLPVIGDMRTIIGGTQVSVVNEWKNPIWTLRELILSLQIGFSTVIIAIAAIFMFFVGVISYWRSFPQVIGLLFIPPFLGAVVTIAVGHHLWPRFFFFTFGFAALVLVRGVFICGQWFGKLLKCSPKQASTIGWVLVSVVILASAIAMPLAYGPKQDFGASLDYLNNHLQPSDQVVTFGIAASVYRGFYGTDWLQVSSSAELEAILDQASSTWVVYTFPEVEKAVFPELMEFIRQNFEIINRFPGTVRAGDIFILKVVHP